MQILVMFVIVLSLVGCGSGRGDDPDTGDDSVGDTVDDATDTGTDVPADTSTESESECALDGDCDDSNPCTTDTCDTDLNLCANDPVDADGDGYPASEAEGTACGGTDCDDTNADIHPGAPRDCAGGADFDCDDMSDRDADGDGFVTQDCTDGDDCDDADADAYPGSTADGCASVDLDCNGLAENDEDDDGHVSDACTGGDDCDDTDPDVYHGAVEDTCNGIDDDCNGELSDTEDVDGDGYANAGCAAAGAEVDCDDEADTIYPGAPELCDMVDQDCDGSILDAPDIDADGDGVPAAACGGTDCDETSDQIHGAFEGYSPDYVSSEYWDAAVAAAEEICDTVDQDCDASALDAPGADSDEDGYLDDSCGGDDCDDLDVDIHPGASPACGADHDCDTVEDDDVDGDGHVSTTCGGDDCDDADAAAYTGAPEVCNDGVDQDCDGSADGPMLMHVSGVRVPEMTVASRYGDLVWADGEYGVVWTGAPTGISDVYLRRVSADGTPLGSDLNVSTTTATAIFPAVAWSGSQYGVMWQDSRDGSVEQFFARVDATGVEVGTEIQITSDVAGSQYVDLVWSGSEWGMTWDRGSITFARAQADGTLIGSPIAAFGTWGTSYPTIVWAGSLYGTAYNFTVSGDDEVYYGRISGEGSVLGSVVHVTNALEDSYDVDLAWSGSLVGVVWEDGRTGFKEIFFQRLDGAAGLVGPNLQVTSASNSAVDPSIAWDGSLFTIVWGDQRSGNYELYMTQISASGVEVMSDLRLSDHPAVQVETELEFSGSSFGVLWQDYRSGSPQAYFDVIDRCQ